MKYATYDSNGVITAHYSTDINTEIPPAAKAITDAQWEISMEGRLLINPQTGEVIKLPEKPDGDYSPSVDGWIVSNLLLPLDALLDKKIGQLKAACEVACRSGWTSDALGAPHTYDTDKDRDQIYLLALNDAALVSCTDEAGVKKMRPHNIIQALQVSDEVRTMLTENKVKYYTKKESLEAAYAANDQEGMLKVRYND